jgi:RHS repeat-associated protein
MRILPRSNSTLVLSGLRLLVLLCGSLCSSAFANVLDTEPQTRNSPLISVPDAVKVDRFSGGASYAYKIDVPPGTGGLTPELSLSYSSLTRGTEYGWGWRLNLSRIERSTRFGAPSYVDANDQFELDGDLLVAGPGNDPNYPPERFYKQRTDFNRIEYFPGNGGTSSYWRVTHTDGTQYLYGSRPEASSRLSTGAGLTGSAFRWALDAVIDARGNEYLIDYECESGGEIICAGIVNNVHPKRIRYSFRSGESAASSVARTQRLVTFEWEPRGHAPEDIDRPTSFRSGFKMQIGRRLLRIRVGLDSNPTNGAIDTGEQIRRYELTYEQKISASNPDGPPFSELASIQRFGPDDVTPFPIAANPRPTRFGYSRPGRGFAATEITLAKPASPLQESTIRFSFNNEDTTAGLWDMNGDGILDRVRTQPNAGARVWRVSLGLATGRGGPGYAAPQDWLWCMDAQQTNCTSTVPTGEEGTHDLLTSVSGQDFGGILVLRVNEDLIDMDGDGLPDRIRSSESGNWTFRKNLGDRFGFAQNWSPPQLTTGNNAQTDVGGRHINAIWSVGNSVEEGKARLIDMNGDGRPDHVAVDNNTPGNLWVSINSGCSGPSGCSFAQPISVVGNFDDHNDVSRLHVTFDSNNLATSETTEEIADVNGDGLPDLTSTRTVSGARCLETGFGNGREFMAWQGTAAIGYTGGARDCRSSGAKWIGSHLGTDFIHNTLGTMLDLNGDGILDRLEQVGSSLSVAFGLGDGTFTTDVFAWSNGGSTVREDYNVSLDTIDIDGDGLLDRVFTTTSCTNCANYQWKAHLSPGPEGLLTSVETELGERDSIEYQSSASFVGVAATTEEPATSTLVPASHGTWVVSRVTRDDGRIGTEKQVTTLAYAEPRFDFALREPRGFRMIDATDAAETLTRSLFHQTTEERGLLEADGTFAAGIALRSHSIGWEAIPAQNEDGIVVPGAVLPEPTLETISTHAGANQQDRVYSRQFDTRFGFATSETDSGGDGLLNTADDLTTTTIYDPVDTVNWFLRHPRTRYQQFSGPGGSPTTVNHELSNYDRGLLAQRIVVRHDPITQSQGGNLTETWQRDEFGNVRFYWPPSRNPSTTGAQVTTTWDSDFATFPATITRDGPVPLTTTYLFDARLGQVKRKLGPRGYLECWDFDGFGRLYAKRDSGTLAGSSISSDCSAARSQFVFPDASLGNADSEYLTAFDQFAASASLERREYFDGLGRTYRTANQAGATDFFVTAKSWGNRGELTCQSEPARAADPAVGAIACGSNAAPAHVTHFDGILRPYEQILRTTSGANRLEETTTYAISNHDGLTGNEIVETHTVYGTPDLHREIGKDPHGDVVSLRELPGETTYLRRDPKGRITLVDGPDVPRLSQSAEPNLLAIKYNSEGQRVRVAQQSSTSDPNSGPHTTYSYDADSNLYFETPARGPNFAITYSYDGLDRLVFKDIAPASSVTSPGPSDTVYTYDSSATYPSRPGDLVKIATSSGVTDLSHDFRGNLVQKIRTIGGTAHPLSYFYDTLGRLLGTNYTQGLTVARKYDGSLLASLYTPNSIQLTQWAQGGGIATLPNPIVDGITHHASGALQDIHYPSGGALTSYTFDPNDYRLSHIATTGPAGTLQDLTYTYDTAGNVGSITDASSTGGGFLSQFFTYDASHRLASAVSSGLYTYPSEAYGYDAGGNLTQKGNWALNYGATIGLGGPHAVSGAHDPAGVDVDYGYDVDGNVTQRVKNAGSEFDWEGFEYTAENRMASYGFFGSPTGSGSATYIYDDSGARVSRVATKSGLAAENTVTVDSDYEVDIARCTTRRHVFVDGRRVLTLETPSSSSSTCDQTVRQFQYHPDQLGTNRLITDETGAVVQRTFAKPFGEIYKVVNGSGTDTSPSNRVSQYLFTDQHADVETGFDYFGARYYDPIVGHFLSVDPELVGASPGATFDEVTTGSSSPDPYRYVSNNPLNRIDRDGRFATQVEEDPFDEEMGPPSGGSEAEVRMEPRPPQPIYTPQALPGSPGSLFPPETLPSIELSEPADACRVEPEEPELARDRTGKVHGDVPTIAQMKGLPLVQIREAIDELKASIMVRQQEARQLGEDGPHRARIGEEEALLRSLEKVLEDKFGARNER